MAKWPCYCVVAATASTACAPAQTPNTRHSQYAAEAPSVGRYTLVATPRGGESLPTDMVYRLDTVTGDTSVLVLAKRDDGSLGSVWARIPEAKR
jgi:hypothetical protein